MSVSSAVVSFALVAGLVTVIPGLDTALVLRAAIRDGVRPAFATALGVSTGALLWGAGAAVGISALLTASTLAYNGLRIVGAGYLAWLGARLLWSAVLGGRESNQGWGEEVRPAGILWQAWRRGLLTNLLNPKIGAFYVAVLPQFIPEHSSALGMGLLLAFVHDLEGMLWFSLLIFGATRMGELLRRPTIGRVVDGATGSALLGFGLRLGLSRQSG
jgi:threonine/homoserine/homoserine lactone efflux protein